jgi:aspartate ammonia-lyase
VEADLLGQLEVPRDAYWGIHTARALANFPISGRAIGENRHLVRALAIVKRAAALTNIELGLLERSIGTSIVDACADVEAGDLDYAFPVDPIQGGAGTSVNMNLNEVIANRALERLGHPRGNYAVVHPNEHINLGQSTNDVYPTALKLALYWQLEDLLQVLSRAQEAFLQKSVDFADIPKLGRTQLQDAVPMSVGQEFAAFGWGIHRDVVHLQELGRQLLETHLGGTAIGTGANTHVDFPARVRVVLAGLSGLPLRPARDMVEATQDTGAFVSVSGGVKRAALRLSKMCNDLRLLSSGPRGGLGELHLPERQAGSSIMPGKVNPVIPEVVTQVAFQVMGNDVTISMAAEAGQLQLNAFEPVMADALFTSMRHLTSAVDVLIRLCIEGIEARPKRTAEHLERSLSLATTLSPIIGYAAASRVAREALSSGRTVEDVILERGLMTQVDLRSALAAHSLAVAPSTSTA